MKILSHAKPLQRKRLLSKAPLSVFKELSNICLNIVHSNIKLSPKQRKLICQNKKLIYLMSKRQVPLKIKKKLLVQKGGFLPALLAGLIPSLIGLFVK